MRVLQSFTNVSVSHRKVGNMQYFLAVLTIMIWATSLVAAYVRGRTDGADELEAVLKRRLPREHMNAVSAALIDEEDAYETSI